jgi:iron complex outermembrane receptor protein
MTPAFAASPPSASASTELEEVIVTAERRTVDIQKTAASVSVRTGDELAVQGRYTTRQILEDIPGVVAVDNSSVNLGGSDVQGNNITIRGITPGPSASTSPNGISAAPGVAVYTDGVYEGIGNAYDIDRVEVLRGPQGTLYGRSATAGVVAFHTRDPGLDGFGGNAAVELGNYDLQHYSAAVNIPLGQTLAVRVAGDYRNQGNGYFDQAATIAKAQNERVKLLWKPNDTFSLLVGFANETNDNYSGGNNKLPVANVTTFAITSSNGPLLPGHKQQRQYWAEANWNVGPATITYIPAYRTWEQRDNNLVDNNFLGAGVSLRQLFLTPHDTFNTHELRVASRDGSTVQWLVGANYYRNVLYNTNHNATQPQGGGAELSVLSDTADQKDTKDLGYFAEATLPLAKSLRMTLGVRYDDTRVVVGEYFYNNPYSLCGNRIGIPIPAFPGGVTCTGPQTATVPPPPGASTPPGGVELNFHNFNYKVRFEYDLTPKNMVYGMLSTGFRPGDAGVRVNGTGYSLNLVDAEKLTAIEAGSKNRFLDDSLQLNVGVYYYNYHGFRTAYIPDTANTLDPSSTGTSVAINVPAHNLGAELEMQYRLTAHDRIGLNYNYVQSKWYDKPAAFAAAQTETSRAMTPSTVTANYEHMFTLPGGSTLSARIDGRYQSAHLNQNLHIDWLRLGYQKYVYLGARTTGNLTGTWASAGGRWSIGAYVRNFTNKVYTTYAVAGSPVNLNVTYSDPRTYGALASLRF